MKPKTWIQNRLHCDVVTLVCVCNRESCLCVCVWVEWGEEEEGCCILVAFKVSLKWGQLHSAREELKYTQAIETNTDAHRILSARALLSCNPNSLSSFPSMTILCITWEMSVVRPQQLCLVCVADCLIAVPKGTWFHSKRHSFAFFLKPK